MRPMKRTVLYCCSYATCHMYNAICNPGLVQGDGAFSYNKIALVGADMASFVDLGD